jgi:sphingolipid C9-methyltransferase
LFKYPTIKNAPLPADGSGAESFNNILLIALLIVLPAYFTYKVGGGLFTWIFFFAILLLPVLIAFWTLASRFSPRINEKARLPGKPVEHYIEFRSEADAARYRGKNKVPMETFHEKYFNSEVDFKGDALEMLEYRHDWASFAFTISLFKFILTGFFPEMLMHTRSQGKC